VLLVSPVRNEANHLQEVVDGVLAQTRPPDLWLIVDDNSDDGTAEIAARACERAPFVRLVSTPPGYTQSNGDRNAAGGPDRAFNFGLDEVDWRSYTYLGKLDGDIVLPPDFVEGILERFAAEPQLGIGSGAVLEEHGEEWRRMRTPLNQATAPARVYSRECYEAIGGMPPYMGADVITTIYAKLRGFTTRTYVELGVRHLRPMASADGVRRGRKRQGAYQYVVHYHPLWIFARSVVVAARFKPYGLSGWWFLEGYLEAALGPTRPVDDPEFRAFTRREQRERVERALSRLTRH
jgi:glycosyltransferase involved in cell wall biosynthesis